VARDGKENAEIEKQMEKKGWVQGLRGSALWERGGFSGTLARLAELRSGGGGNDKRRHVRQKGQKRHAIHSEKEER
jgi:hypothetical protein